MTGAALKLPRVVGSNRKTPPKSTSHKRSTARHDNEEYYGGQQSQPLTVKCKPYLSDHER